jgi:hypothetical protein
MGLGKRRGALLIDVEDRDELRPGGLCNCSRVPRTGATGAEHGDT